MLTGCGASETKSIMTSDSAASVVNSTTRENYSGGVAYDNAEIAVAEEDMAMESGGKTTSQSQQTPSALLCHKHPFPFFVIIILMPSLATQIVIL